MYLLHYASYFSRSAIALPSASQAASVSALRLCFISTGVPTSSNFICVSFHSVIFFTTWPAHVNEPKMPR